MLGGAGAPPPSVHHLQTKLKFLTCKELRFVRFEITQTAMPPSIRGEAYDVPSAGLFCHGTGVVTHAGSIAVHLLAGRVGPSRALTRRSFIPVQGRVGCWSKADAIVDVVDKIAADGDRFRGIVLRCDKGTRPDRERTQCLGADSTEPVPVTTTYGHLA